MKPRSRRAVLGLFASLPLVSPACTPSEVRAVAKDPIAPVADAATLVGMMAGRDRYGTAWLADAVGSEPPRMLGALEVFTHFVVRVPPGRHMIVAYDDDSYEAIEGDLAPGAIYAVNIERSGLDLVLRPVVPQRESIRRLLDETTRVELAREPKADELERMRKKFVLARYRYSRDAEDKRALRFLRAEHAWR